MRVNVKQIAKIGDTIINMGAGLYMFKKMGLFNKFNKKQNNKTNVTNYYELAVVIINSDMLDSYKEELVELVEKYEVPSYYKAVAEIVNGDMLTSTKIEMIKTMSLK